MDTAIPIQASHKQISSKIWQLIQEKSMLTITSSTDLWRSSSRVLVIPRGVHRNLFSSSTRKPQQGFKANPSLLCLSIGQRSSALSRSNDRMNKIVCNVSGVPTPPGAPSHSWKGWMIGILLSVVIPFWRHKWGPLLAIKNQVDTVIDTVESVAEVVEAVAHKVEEVADGIADKLPEDGKLKAAVEAIEAIAKETAKDAHIVDELIENVEAVEDKVENFFDSAMDGAGDQVTKVDVGGDGSGGEGNVEEKKIQ